MLQTTAFAREHIQQNKKKKKMYHLHFLASKKELTLENIGIYSLEAKKLICNSENIRVVSS